jgi:putative transposase
MQETMPAVCADFETEPVEVNGDNNHVYLLVSFPPKIALAKLVNGPKGVSSRRIWAGAATRGDYYPANKLCRARTSPTTSAAHRPVSSVSTSRN